MSNKCRYAKTIIIILLLVTSLANAQDNSTSPRPMMSRALLHNTVRIEIQKADGSAGLGTGFYYTYSYPETTSSVPVIVTCKHVISGSVVGRIHFALGKTNAFGRSQDDYPVIIPQFEQMWIQHPDTNIDLVVLPLAPLIRKMESEGKIIDFAPLNEKFIPTKDELSESSIFREVKFIGYPIGIWDQKNNLPIIRRGMTATDPVIDYNERREFLIDAAVFPGSSGSPVFIAEEGTHFTSRGMSFGGATLQFLGILYAVNEFDSEGKVNVVTIPTAFDIKVRTQIPANLGLVMKAELLNDFKKIFEEKEPALKPSVPNNGTNSTPVPNKD